MADLIISCLSQKGGVGKSTIARLVARTYAVAGWAVKICDFNATQLTSVKWARMRETAGIKPPIAAEPHTTPTSLPRERFDLVVADGRPDSDQSSMEIARVSTLIIIPTGLSLDDLEPQLMFANELVAKGIEKQRILFVLLKTVESRIAVFEARKYLHQSTGFLVAEQDIAARISYQRAQNYGYALSEVGEHIGRLEENADLLAAEIVNYATDLQRKAA